MGWMQRVTVFPGLQDRVQSEFESFFEAAGAKAEHALFMRNSKDMRHTIFLVSPSAVAFTTINGGTWTDVDPTSEKWIFLVGHQDAPARLGISTGY